MSRGRGADAVARALAAAGVRHVFTLSGNHVMPVFDATVDTGLDLLHVRHEAAAVHMADAWARLTGQVGVALVTGGPGHANALGALYTAAMAEAPVVLLSGHAPRGQAGRGAFQEMRQAEIAAPLTKAAWTSTGSETVAADVAGAIRLALSGRPGPVHLSLPNDVLDAAAPFDLSARAFQPEVAALDPAIAQTIVERLRRAERALVLTGPVLLTRRGREAVARLEEALGVPVVGMESPRGIGDPALGAFAEVLARADCILLLGKRLDFTLKFGQPPALDSGCEFLQVDPDPAEHERARHAVGLRALLVSTGAEMFAAVAALTRAAQSSPSRASPWRDEVRSAIAFRPATWDHASATSAGRLHPVQACRPLQALLDAHRDAVFVSDGGEFGQWAQACLAAPHRVINGMAGAIGAAFPFALAARLAFPDAPVIAALGDGTFGFHAAEIDTGVRYGLPFVAVVGNDARWNAEYQIQVRDYGRDRAVGCDLLPTRYDQVCAAFGGHGELVTEANALLPAVRRALAARRPAVVNAMIEGLAAPNVRR